MNIFIKGPFLSPVMIFLKKGHFSVLKEDMSLCDLPYSSQKPLLAHVSYLFQVDCEVLMSSADSRVISRGLYSTEFLKTS